MQSIAKCRACESKNLTDFLNLGEQYLSDFRHDGSKPPKYQLLATLCQDCKLVQLRHTTPQHEMYHDRYGFKSGISDSIKRDLDEIVTHAFQYKNDPKSWLDIASNDGTLLSFVPKDVFRIGVDPVTFLCEEAQQHADAIVNEYFTADVVKSFKPFDVVTSVSCFYDMPDPSKFVKDVVSVMSEKSVWIIQQNYLLTTMELKAVDNFCHEHLEYYTLLSLENLLGRFGLEINEVLLSAVNGGSIRTVVSHKGMFPIDPSVGKQRLLEKKARMGTIEPYLEFAEQISDQLDKLNDLVTDLKIEGNTICILAASTRGATIWQSAQIDEFLIDYAVERNPAKVGAIFSAIGVPIISEGEFRKRRPDYAIIGPWFFRDEIIDREAEYLKAGGHLIVPLPEVEII